MNESLIARLEAGYYIDKDNISDLTHDEYVVCFNAACSSGVVSNIRLFNVEDNTARFGMLAAITNGHIEALQWLLWKYKADETTMQCIARFAAKSEKSFKYNKHCSYSIEHPMKKLLEIDIPIITDELMKYRLHMNNISLWLMELLSE